MLQLLQLRADIRELRDIKNTNEHISICISMELINAN